MSRIVISALFTSMLFVSVAGAQAPSVEQVIAYTAKLPRITLSGTCDNKVSTIFIDRARAEAMLPKELELVPQPYFPEGQHALQIMFQVTSELKMVGSPFPEFPAYNEVILAVRSVRIKGGKGRVYDYYKKLYLDSVIPVVLGYYVGFPKHVGEFERGDTFFRAAALGGSEVANVNFKAKTDYDVEAFKANFEMLKQVTPHQDVIADGYGKLVCSRFTFDWDTAVAAPIDAQWDLFKKLQPAVIGTYVMPGFDQTPLGGLSLKASWKLTGPLNCD